MLRISALFNSGDTKGAETLLASYNTTYADMAPVKPAQQAEPKQATHQVSTKRWTKEEIDAADAIWKAEKALKGALLNKPKGFGREAQQLLLSSLEDAAVHPQGSSANIATSSDPNTEVTIDPSRREPRPYSLILDPVLAEETTTVQARRTTPAPTQSQIQTTSAHAVNSEEPTEDQIARSKLTKEVFVLKNGDLLQGGILFPQSAQIEAGYTPLQPYLHERMKTMHPPVPVLCFRRTWLLEDQARWQRPRTESEKKKAKLAPNSALPTDLTMEYVDFNDTTDHFIEYVEFVYGWSVYAERFKALKTRCIKLKVKSNCWMLALRYFVKVVEGVMTETPNGIVPNAAELQVKLMEEALDAVAQFEERQFKGDNPYAPGGKRQFHDPSTNVLRSGESDSSANTKASTSTTAPAPTPAPPADDRNAPETSGGRERGGNRNRGGRGGGGRGGRGNRRGRSRDFNSRDNYSRDNYSRDSYNRDHYSRDSYRGGRGRDYSRSPDRRRYHDDRNRSDRRDSPNRGNRDNRRGGRE